MRTTPGFEQGPIRPPSEAMSLLVRVSRNCPWNRCAFCPVYKGARFSLRSTAEVLADLDAMQALNSPAPTSVFLQDANALLTPTDDLVRILAGIRERFPSVRRITTYARAHTLTRRSPTELERIRDAGLNRIHVGLESGSDEVLKLVCKGTTRAQQIAGGRRAKDAGFELSEYVMPGLGGRALSAVHAEQTASALCEIVPDFVRVRTTVALPGTELASMVARDDFHPLGEVELVGELRSLLEGLAGLRTRFESDHAMNLLIELRGNLPAEHHRLVQLCDAFLGLPAERQHQFMLGRRLGLITHMKHLDSPDVQEQLSGVVGRARASGQALEEVVAALRGRVL